MKWPLPLSLWGTSAHSGFTGCQRAAPSLCGKAHCIAANLRCCAEHLQCNTLHLSASKLISTVELATQLQYMLTEQVCLSPPQPTEEIATWSEWNQAQKDQLYACVISPNKHCSLKGRPWFLKGVVAIKWSTYIENEVTWSFCLSPNKRFIDNAQILDLRKHSANILKYIVYIQIPPFYAAAVLCRLCSSSHTYFVLNNNPVRKARLKDGPNPSKNLNLDLPSLSSTMQTTTSHWLSLHKLYFLFHGCSSHHNFFMDKVLYHMQNSSPFLEGMSPYCHRSKTALTGRKMGFFKHTYRVLDNDQKIV